MTEQKKTRAPGAGVKAEDGAGPLVRKQVRIDQGTEDLLTAVGDGNFSLGVREAARRLVESGDIEPFSVEKHGARAK